MLTLNIKKKLANYTLDVQLAVANEITVLFGPSGSGKTTILHAISGLVKINAGEIILNNKLLTHNKKLTVPIQRRNIGYLFQDYALFPHKTVWENIQYGAKDIIFAEQLVKNFQIDHLKAQYPHEISGGEKQRTALIRALATEPELLLLDEPFSALDDKTKEISYAQLIEVQQNWNIPIILVTHSKEEVELLADTVHYIHEGKIVESEQKMPHK